MTEARSIVVCGIRAPAVACAGYAADEAVGARHRPGGTLLVIVDLFTNFTAL